MGFNLVNNGAVAIALKFVQMPTNQIAQFIQAAAGPIHFGLKLVEDLLGPVAEKLDQNVVFIFKIQINCPVGDTGFFSNLCDRTLMKSLSGKYFDSRFQDSMVFIVFVFIVILWQFHFLIKNQIK
jgi:hypothetical protein